MALRNTDGTESGPTTNLKQTPTKQKDCPATKHQIMKNRFTLKERTCIAHAINLMEHNKIADSDYCGSGGWYYGNKEQFIKKHKEAIQTLTKFLNEKVSSTQ
jgi:hypothetical protein